MLGEAGCQDAFVIILGRHDYPRTIPIGLGWGTDLNEDVAREHAWKPQTRSFDST